jgi:hypothetical protein
LMAWTLGGRTGDCLGWHRNPNSTQAPPATPLRPSSRTKLDIVGR